MDQPIPTVRIKSDDTECGYLIINVADRKESDELYVEPAAEGEANTSSDGEAAAAKATAAVPKTGKAKA